MSSIFHPIQPNRSWHLPVGDGHALYVETVGNPQGLPVVFLHGGPGGGFSPKHRQLFDPRKYHAILFDQRGCGRSTPFASLENNTTPHLIADMEQLREALGIEKWLVFGGSWGSTLALAYAEAHPDRVSGLILRGIFLCRPEEIRWFYQEGCHWIYPDRWQSYWQHIPESERGDMLSAYHQRLTSPDPKIQLAAAKAWSGWEGSTCCLIPDEATIQDFEMDEKAIAMARIECHYFKHHSFLESPNALLENINRIRHIPTWIVHGRYDVICPVKNAWDLHQAFPEAKLTIVPDAGHAFSEPGITQALLQALKDFQP